MGEPVRSSPSAVADEDSPASVPRDRLRWTHGAEESLRGVYESIARTRPRTAERTVESIVNKVASLTASPSLGQRYPHVEREEVLHLAYGHFRIAYSVEGDGSVTVLGVFHGLIFLPPA